MEEQELKIAGKTKWRDRFEWERLDELILFLIAALLIAGLAFMAAKIPTNFPAEAWTAVAVLVTAVARTIKRNGKETKENDKQITD